MSEQKSPLTRISRAYRHFERLTEVMRIMVKFGFGDLFDRLGLGDILIRARRLVGLAVPDSRPTRPLRLRQALEEMGPVFIKLGQYLSTRQDILPADYLDELTHLQDSVPPIVASEVQKIIAQELDESVIVDISPEPLAAASIGQVHSAKLQDGQEVVIKIRRPGLNKIVKTDLEILAELAVQVEKYIPFLDFIHPTDIVGEFKRSLNAELNYRLEAVNIERFGHYYRENPEVKIPTLYKTLCTENVLVMEKISGLKIDDLEGLKESSIDVTKVAQLASRVAIDQIVNFGFFHADPHPGNLLIMPGPVLGFIDFGLVGVIDRKFRDHLLGLALGVVSRSEARVVRHILRITKPINPPNREALELEVGVFLETHLSGSLKDIKVSLLLKDILELLNDNGLKTPNNLLLLVKSLSQLESLGLKLSPDFKIIEEAKPVISKIYGQRFSPVHWFKYLNRHGLEALMTLESLPDELSPLYDTVKSGRVPADLTIKGMDRMNRLINQASYRLTFAIVLASLVIGSSLVIHSKLPPLWHGLPIIGLIGFLAAGIVGFWLVLDFLRKYREL
ncbi:MAG: phosphotransferase [Deltaproteobacteria bacterium]|nr:phosphotransferase [Deltaproteobacteria bacterium]